MRTAGEGRARRERMRYVSTRATAGHGTAPGVTLRRALLDGLAPDGGLYVPDVLPTWTAEEIDALSSLDLAELGARVLCPFVGDEIEPCRLDDIVADALDFPIPLVEIEPGICVLELFHGPTLAFKDVGARVMARLIAALHDGGDPLTILVATSGDTGGAVAHAFSGIAAARVVVLYPRGRVSRTQEAQLTMFNAVRGSNVRAYPVDGSFDDCQRLVKRSFADESLRRQARLTSANSINIGRLLPQVIYYFWAVARCNAPTLISVPSGNFGNLTAGIIAKRAGLPIRRFIAATNVNASVPDYLATGRFSPRPSIATIANAMDVGDPSNFERLRYFAGGSLDAMRAEIVGSAHTDAEVRDTIRRMHDAHGYVLDPHSAIAYLALTRVNANGGGLVLATAHPAKFADVVEPIIGRRLALPAPLERALRHAAPLTAIPATAAAVGDVVRAQASAREAG